eukprot:899951-Prorocentrum_minimum.AAC.1
MIYEVGQHCYFRFTGPPAPVKARVHTPQTLLMKRVDITPFLAGPPAPVTARVHTTPLVKIPPPGW